MNSNDDMSSSSHASAEDQTATAAFRAELNHRLRTPLNAIIGFSELLALRAGTRDEGDLRQILKSARAMLAIIEEELGEEPGKRSDAGDGSAETPTRSCDVLYVEDDQVNFTLVERILEFRPKLRLLHAAQGLLGVEMAEAYQPKLVLLDLNLPDIDGAEVMRRLQKEPSTAQIPVVILSANATPSQIERLLTAGARNYLTKPFDLNIFLAVVDEFVAP